MLCCVCAVPQLYVCPVSPLLCSPILACVSCMASIYGVCAGRTGVQWCTMVYFCWCMSFQVKTLSNDYCCDVGTGKLAGRHQLSDISGCNVVLLVQPCACLARMLCAYAICTRYRCVNSWVIVKAATVPSSWWCHTPA